MAGLVHALHHSPKQLEAALSDVPKIALCGYHWVKSTKDNLLHSTTTNELSVNGEEGWTVTGLPLHSSVFISWGTRGRSTSGAG